VLAAFRVSVLSALWTTTSAIAAVAIGFTSASAVAVALGSVTLVDAIGSLALALHFLHGLRHERFSARREQVAHVAVCTGLIVVGIASMTGGAARLALGEGTRASLSVAVLAGVSLLVLATLGVRKLELGRRVSSPTLVGDGRLSLIGAAQALVALASSAAAHWLDVDWPDAAATIAVGALAVVVGRLTWRDAPEL
jgi:hypothetical protein